MKLEGKPKKKKKKKGQPSYIMKGLGCHTKQFRLNSKRIKEEALKYFSQENH